MSSKCRTVAVCRRNSSCVIIIAAVRELDRNLEHAAATLGPLPLSDIAQGRCATAGSRFGRCLGIMSSPHSFDELIVTLFLIGREPETLPSKMWSDVQIQTDPVISAASSTIMTVVAPLANARNFMGGNRRCTLEW